MVGFGYKQGWLAIRDGEIGPAFEALAAREIGPVSWRVGVDRAYTHDHLLVATPLLTGVRGTSWMLVVGRWLLVHEQWLDVRELSATLGREVQFFATYRVSELHRWDRAVDGAMVRSFRYVGEVGEVTDWTGDPDAAELELGLPVAFDPRSDLIVDESDVLRLAAAWSIDPTALDGRPAPGPLTAATV